MTNQEQRIDAMIFDYDTTMNNDFRHNEFKQVKKTMYVEKKPFIREPWTYVKYLHTMRNWDGQRAPFDVMIPTKPILRTNPHHVQAVYEKPKDLEYERARQTRPRLVMTPAISMDDIDDVDKWTLLSNSSYTTRVSTDFPPVTIKSNIVAPLRGVYTPPSLLTIAKYKQPYVSPEWRAQTTRWDRRQVRDYCDATKVFWLYTKPKRCNNDSTERGEDGTGTEYSIRNL